MQHLQSVRWKLASCVTRYCFVVVHFIFYYLITLYNSIFKIIIRTLKGKQEQTNSKLNNLTGCSTNGGEEGCI
jgi:hypothetical protein